METSCFVTLLASMRKRIGKNEPAVSIAEGLEAHLLSECGYFERMLSKTAPTVDAVPTKLALRPLLGALLDRGAAAVAESWRWRALAVLLLRNLAEHVTLCRPEDGAFEVSPALGSGSFLEEMCALVLEWLNGDEGHICCMICDIEERSTLTLP